MILHCGNRPFRLGRFKRLHGDQLRLSLRRCLYSSPNLFGRCRGTPKPVSFYKIAQCEIA